MEQQEKELADCWMIEVALTARQSSGLGDCWPQRVLGLELVEVHIVDQGR